MFAVYKSSAGSGKTFTLVKEYLKICLVQPGRYSSILAITFTNKAAAEMKTRIIDSLHRFLSTGSDEIIRCVIEETKIDSHLAAENSKTLLDNILHSYSDFSVMTIDSFIGRIVHAFSYDLDMPLKYDVELNTSGITAEIVERLLDEARPGNFTGDVLTLFAISKIQSSGSWSIDRDLNTIGGITFNEKYAEPVSLLASPRYDEAFWRKLIRTIDDNVSGSKTRICELSRQGADIIQKHGLTVDDFAYKENGPAGALIKFARAVHTEDFKMGQRFRAGEWMTKSVRQETRDKIELACIDGLDKIRTELIDQIIRLFSYHLVRENIYSEALIQQFICLTEAYKTEENIVPLFDFSKKVSDVVKNEPVPYLYWRMGDKYSHIMIDEFQDTSRLQWMNLKPLVEETLANGHFSMAVGDGKQAVYRWRAGDVTIMENRLPEDLGPFIEPFQLDQNFRSRKEIVDFNNQFFTGLPDEWRGSGESLFPGLYSGESVLQKCASNRLGYVQVTTVQTAGMNKAGKHELILEKMASDIQSILSEGNGYSPGDIAVLVRWNRDAESAARFLSEKGIGVISPDTLLLKNAGAVTFVISALRVLASEDRIALLNMWLYSGKDAKEFEKRDRLKAGQDGILRSISENFADSTARLYQLPVYEAVEEIIRIFKLGRTNSGFLQGLLEAVLSFSEKMPSDIARFLEWWDEEGTKPGLSASETGDAVTVSTIHKAKGLEYPIVLIPFGWNLVDRPEGDKPNLLWTEDGRFGPGLEDFPFIIDMKSDAEDSWFREPYLAEQEMSRIDNLNLLYVAFTRAADRLYLYAADSSRTQKELRDTHDLIRQVTAGMDLNKSAEGLSLGAKTAKAEAPVPSNSLVQDSLPACGWRSRITMKRRAEELWKLDEPELKEKAEAGLLIHEILAGITTEADIEKAVELQVKAGSIGSGEKDDYIAKIAGLMDISYSKGKVRDWFRPGLDVRNEISIGSQDRESRPDRVVMDKDRTLVIDFKTGRRVDEHIEQIYGYGKLLEEMGYRNIEKCLVYIESREVVEV